MINEPELKIREDLLNDYNSKNFSKLLKDINKLQKSFPNSLFLLSLLGTINNQLGNYKEAIHNFEKIIQINPKFADAHYNLGVILKNNNQINRAIECFEKSITLNPNKFEAYNNLGNIYRDKHKTELAIKYYLNSLEINPDYLIALKNFGICLQNFEFSKYSTVVEKHIINLLNKNKILRTVDIIDNLIKFIYLDIENNSTINNFGKIETQISLDDLIIKVLNIKILPVLFKTTPITDLKIEKILKNLRSKILLNISSIKNSENALKIMELIASQCFINEYIYPVSEEENLALKKIEKELKNDLENNNLKKFILHIVCLSSYKSLATYSWSSRLLGIKEIKDLVNEQIVYQEKEFNIRKNLKSLEIKNSISLKVKNQYENNPYPRWDKIALITSPSKPADYFKNLSLNINEKKINKWKNIDVLVAGCGTGQHAITTATKYKNSFVTALDLSAHSLSYAKRKADELKIENINFIQMDLLNLKKIDKKFHIIEAVGVLHHMDKPFEGWRLLYNKLDLGGLMMIGLYSDIARKHIKRIRNDIKKIKIKIDKKNIIEFREKIILSNSDKYKLIKQSPDFYSFSNLVDLLFHVQEHRFTIPEINDCINKLNLKFCGFENRTLVNSFYKIYKDEKDLYNLDLWNKFEINNPRIFAGMYQFWCQKI